MNFQTVYKIVFISLLGVPLRGKPLRVGCSAIPLRFSLRTPSLAALARSLAVAVATCDCDVAPYPNAKNF